MAEGTAFSIEVEENLNLLPRNRYML